MIRSKTICMFLGLVSFAMHIQAQQALPSTQAPDLINTLQQREWVSLDSGSIHGTLHVLDSKGELQNQAGATVSLIVNDKVVAQSTTDAEGSFKLTQVEAGAYALVAKSDKTFSTFALHVVDSGERLSSNLDIYSTSLTPERAQELIADHWVPSQNSEQYYRNFTTDPLSNARKFNDSHRVLLQDGNLLGRVSRPGWSFSEQDLSGTVAHVLRNGSVVASAPVSKDGRFTIKSVEPGVYDLFVAGEDGIAVVGFQAISSADVASREKQNNVLVSVVSYNNEICCELAQPVMSAPAPVVQDVVVNDPGMGAPIIGDPIIGGGPMMGGGFAGPGGGFGGGGMGGGGIGGGGIGGGGGGGLGGGVGGLLGIAGLAIGVAALAGNDDGFNPGDASRVQ